MTISSYKNDFFKKLLPIYNDYEEVQSLFYKVVLHQLKLKRIDVALQPSYEIGVQTYISLENILNRLLNEEPLQYILGETYFFDLTFKVNKNVLIPRPETEELVYWICSHFNKNEELKILDIGTGSGCIAISLAKYFKKAKVTAIDYSKEALTTANENAILNNVTVTFIQEDILTLTSLENSFDIIVSNPPYVRLKEKQNMKKNVLEFEPAIALFVPNDDALIFYDKIASLAKKSLSKSGLLFFEINQYLGNQTLKKLEDKGFTARQLKKDIFGNDRMIKAKI